MSTHIFVKLKKGKLYKSLGVDGCVAECLCLYYVPQSVKKNRYLPSQCIELNVDGVKELCDWTY
jgi:hypothetical protein